MIHDIGEAFPDVSVDPQQEHMVNIESDQFGSRVWGFEIPLRMRQTVRTIRKKPTNLFNDIQKFDIHVVDSKTILRSKGVFEFTPPESGGPYG